MGSQMAQGTEDKERGSFLDAPLFRRIVGFTCDYTIGAAITLAVTMLPYCVMRGGWSVFLSDYLLIGVDVAYVAALVALAVALSWAYYVLVPWKVWPGKTLGKRWAQTTLVKLDGDDVGVGALTLRWLIMLLVELPSIFAGASLVQLVGLSGGGGVVTAWQIAGGVAFAASFVAVLVTYNHRALHDYAVGTWVYTDE